MTEFKALLLAIALFVVTVGNLSSATQFVINKCISITKHNYGNDRKISGVENFKHSFLNKTEAIIKDQFKPIPDDDVNYDVYKENKRILSLGLVMGYFKYLYTYKDIEIHNVFSRTVWCHIEAPQVLTHIQMDNIDINDDDFNKEGQEQICLRYVKYLDIYNDLGEESFENELKKFYFETTEDMVTAENMYEKTNDVESEKKEIRMFYLKSYAVAYYEQYKNFVINLVDEYNVMFRSVNNFCNFDGKDIVWYHFVVSSGEPEESEE